MESNHEPLKSCQHFLGHVSCLWNQKSVYNSYLYEKRTISSGIEPLSSNLQLSTLPTKPSSHVKEGFPTFSHILRFLDLNISLRLYLVHLSDSLAHLHIAVQALLFISFQTFSIDKPVVLFWHFIPNIKAQSLLKLMLFYWEELFDTCQIQLRRRKT